MNGVIFVAQGANYCELAIQSASSLRALLPDLPIDLFTDQRCKEPVFDAVHAIPEGPTPKLASLPHSRFERTLYLDCDTIVLSELGDIFDLLDRFSLAVAHDVRRTSRLIGEEGSHHTPYAFPQMNGGVILYKNTPEVMQFLADWQKQYVILGRKRDQVSLKDVLWSSEICFYVLPPEFNLRRVTMLDAWEPLDARPTIVHSHRLLQHIRGLGPRLTDLAQILSEERTALQEEWDRIPGGRIGNSDSCPAMKFARAEKWEKGDEVETDTLRNSSG